MLRVLDTWGMDARFALRQLVRAPLVGVVAIVTLAVGIGFNTAVFSLVHAVLLRPLPYPDADRLTWISPYDAFWATDTQGPRGHYRIYRQQTHLFERMTAYGTQDLSLVAGDEASQERVASIEGDYWTLTGARPALGRLFGDDDQQAVVLSHGLFQRRFGGDASIIGRAVEVGGAPFIVAGVLPETFRVVFPQQTVPGDELRDLDAFIALPHGQEAPGRPIVPVGRPAPPWVRVVGRLRAEVTVARARTEMQALHARLERDFPRHQWLQRTLRIMPLQEKLAEPVRASLLVLQGAVVLVLLIAVANVANLLLAHAAQRTREAAIRTALGAGRRRLVRQFLVESIVLALIAGTAGVLVAYLAIPLLVGLAPYTVTGVADITVDASVLAFSLPLTLSTALLFAWAPIVETARVDPATTLGGTTPSATPRGTRTQGLLISLEVALAVLLLTAAGLMLKSLWRLQSHGPGFSPEGTYTMRIPLTGPRYEQDLGPKYAYITELLQKLEQTPGVEAAGVAGSTYNIPFTAAGGVDRGAPGAQQMVAVRMVSPAYLRAMGVSLVRGRWPAPSEALDAIVVNETFARRLMPKGDPIGQPVSGSFLSGTIVGVAHDVVGASLDADARAELFYPWQRSPSTGSIAVAVRMPEAMVPVVRSVVENLDRTQPVYQFQSLEEALAESVAPRRFNMFLLQIYAGAAALLALVGTFGVVARTVSRRTRETALRIAIGARPAAVVLLIVRDAMRYVLLGIGVGVAAALGAGQVMRGLLHGIEPHDPSTLAAVAVGLTVAAFAACALPALRAASVDPVVALRQD
jgi:putative ABC transport system permease protein